MADRDELIVHSPDCPHSTHSVRREIERLKREIKRLTAENERLTVALLRASGCRCSAPLLGWRPEKGPRCRLCNTLSDIDESHEGAGK